MPILRCLACWEAENMKTKTKSFIARNKLRLFNGMGFLGTIMSIFNFLTFAKVWSSTFEYYGIPLIFVYVFVPLGLVFGCWYFWYWYEMSGVWEEEVAHQNENVNPQLTEYMEDIKAIKKHLGIADKEVTS